jgi:hypothetical protein
MGSKAREGVLRFSCVANGSHATEQDVPSVACARTAQHATSKQKGCGGVPIEASKIALERQVNVCVKSY